jgi:hypothetical protein
MRIPPVRSVLMIVAITPFPASLVAQHHGSIGVAVPAPLLPSPYADSEAAVRIASDMLVDAPADVRLHLVIAREASALGIVRASKGERIDWLVRAHESASAAFALDSMNADVGYWVSASAGLRADEEGGRTKIALARQAYAYTLRTLELDSLHPGANHIMGRLHAGAKRLGWLNRVIARALGLGEIMDAASWEGAERHLRFAAEGDPGQLVHLYELGRLLAERSDALNADPEEGLSILRDVAGRAPRHALDSVYVARAREALTHRDRD